MACRCEVTLAAAEQGQHWTNCPDMFFSLFYFLLPGDVLIIRARYGRGEWSNNFCSNKLMVVCTLQLELKAGCLRITFNLKCLKYPLHWIIWRSKTAFVFDDFTYVKVHFCCSVHHHLLISWNLYLFALQIFGTYRKCKAEERDKTAVSMHEGVCGQNPTKAECWML